LIDFYLGFVLPAAMSMQTLTWRYLYTQQAAALFLNQLQRLLQGLSDIIRSQHSRPVYMENGFSGVQLQPNQFYRAWCYTLLKFFAMR
tara:strand:+ start:95 stop:358 length:264 start_codon:yes stop_codon:yes gene_type:complete